MKLVRAPPSGFGSFHQQYRIDGRLVAVGVVDILPFCLSSKYFFWEPSLKALALGKLSSLREIDWVREASTHCPTLRYYYMGYYIHTCPKMRYKAEYKPSELKCPVTGAWVSFEKDAKPVLDSGKFGPLDPNWKRKRRKNNRREGGGGGGGGIGGRSDGVHMSSGKSGEDDGVSDIHDDNDDAEEGALDKTSKNRTDDAEDTSDSTILGLVAGNQLLDCAPFSRCAPGLPTAAVATLRPRLRRWRTQAGPAGERMVYLVSLDHLISASDDDEDDDGEEEGVLFDDEDDDEDEEEEEDGRRFP